MDTFSIDGMLKTFADTLEVQRLAEAKNIIDGINNKKRKIKAKKEQIEDLQYESDLITRDIINTIKIDLYRSEYNLFSMISANTFWEAWTYKGTKKWDDKEKKKEFKKSYNFIVDRIKEEILKNNDEFKLINIIDSNYSTFYNFEYEYKDIKIGISIPIYIHANKDNYEDLLKGYRALICQSGACWQQIICDLNYREVADKLESYLKEKFKDVENKE